VSNEFGRQLPSMSGPVPGPASRALARRIAAVECRNISGSESPPIFWEAARGANVRDADGNIYIDLTAGFSVAAAGHANPRVTDAIARQAATLPHGLGDVYPTRVKVELLERLAAVAPDPLGVTILASSGAEAVEAALKTAMLRTGRPGILAFTGAYHGLTYGALAATWRAEFRKPFSPQLYGGVRFAPYPAPSPDPDVAAAGSLARVRELLRDAESSEAPIGAIIVEPIQGRGGILVPSPAFLQGLRELCDGERIVLVFDEVYTGFGRTGRWFALEHAGVVPDLLVVGKALTGALPFSALIGSPSVMDAWPPSTGEAIHTSTFLGNPIACAAALAQLEEIERNGLVARAAELGEYVEARLRSWRDRFDVVGDTRGVGLMLGVELVAPGEPERPATETAARVVRDALRQGVILLAEGPAANVLAVTPPLTITRDQLDFALDAIENALSA